MRGAWAVLVVLGMAGRGWALRTPEEVVEPLGISTMTREQFRVLVPTGPARDWADPFQLPPGAEPALSFGVQGGSFGLGRTQLRHDAGRSRLGWEFSTFGGETEREREERQRFAWTGAVPLNAGSPAGPGRSVTPRGADSPLGEVEVGVDAGLKRRLLERGDSLSGRVGAGLAPPWPGEARAHLGVSRHTIAGQAAPVPAGFSQDSRDVSWEAGLEGGATPVPSWWLESRAFLAEDHLSVGGGASDRRRPLALRLAARRLIGERISVGAGIGHWREGGFNTVLPSGGVFYTMSADERVWVEYEPTVLFARARYRELYEDGEDVVVNPDLAPEERVVAVRVGGESRRWGVWGRMNVTHEELRNQIVWNEEQSRRIPVNLARTGRDTVEVTLSVPAPEGRLEPGLEYRYQAVTNRADGRAVPDTPAHRVGIRLGYRAGDWQADSSWRYVTTRVTHADTPSTLGEYATLSARVSRRLGASYTLALEGDNLLGRRYELRPGIPRSSPRVSLTLTAGFTHVR